CMHTYMHHRLRRGRRAGQQRARRRLRPMRWGTAELRRWSKATGISKARIRAGIRDLAEQAANPTTIPALAQRARRPGAGRRSLTDKSREAVVALIQGTTTKAGLEVRAKLDKRSYAVGKSVSDFAMKQLRVRTH